MSVLSGIKESVQQVAEAISIAVGLEVEIVDNRLRIIGGTGYYHGRIGKKEEDGNLEGNYLYARACCVRERLSTWRTPRTSRDTISRWSATPDSESSLRYALR